VAAGLNYVNLQLIEASLGKEHFPDALTRDAKGNVYLSVKNRIKSDEPVTPAFYWGNTLASHTMRCFEQLAQKRGVAGISFDNSMGTGMRYGPGPENSPGRAFNKASEAVWAAEGIAMAKQMDLYLSRTSNRPNIIAMDRLYSRRIRWLQKI